MNLNFNMEMVGLDKQKDKTLRGSKKVLWLAMNKMQNLAKEKAPSDTGELRRRINLQPRSEGAKEYNLNDGVDYGVHVEFGTSPHYPPIEPLKKWSRRVLGDESAAYAVQKAISKRGTPAQPFFRPALLEVKRVHINRIMRGITS